MTHWNTSDVLSLLATEGWKCKSFGQGGGYDTGNIQMTKKGADPLFICGFRVETEITPEECDNTEVEMVEVTDGKDSRGGLNSSNQETCLLYGSVVYRLRNAGFDVVPRLKDYF